MSILNTLLVNVLFKPIINVFTKSVKGQCNILKGGFVLASNHVSFIDSAFILYAFKKYFKRDVIFLGEKMYFSHKLFSPFLKEFNTIKLDSHKGLEEGENKEAYKEVLKVLKNNGIIGIYPEGKRSKDGNLLEGKTGVVRIAFKAKKPIIPIKITGTHGIWPVGQKIPVFKNRVSISIGKPINLKKYYGNESRKVYRELTNKLMDTIKNL